jgi:hypothetical protein
VVILQCSRNNFFLAAVAKRELYEPAARITIHPKIQDSGVF